MKTITVQLVKKKSTETDPFGKPIETDEIVDVPGCLVGKPTESIYNASMDMYGKQIEYVIGVPKTDSNDWIDTEVLFFGQRFITVGFPETGIQENIPMKWGKNVKVARYG